MKYNRNLFSFHSLHARDTVIKRDGIHWEGIVLMIDMYNGRLINHRHDVWHVEHIVPLKSAWENGFKTLYQVNRDKALSKMAQFANDPRNLTPVSASSNQSRGHKTLWNWVPLNLAIVPVRNALVRELYDDYGLTLTKSQQWALDWSDKKILHKHKYGIHMGKTRAWLLAHGFHRAFMPF